MGIQLHFASLSLSASVDQQTGSLSVFDLIEEIRAPQLPIHLQSMVISIALEKQDPEVFDGELLIHLLTPDGKQQKAGNGEIHVPKDQGRMKAVFRYNGFPIKSFGPHRFVLSWLDSSKAKVGEAILKFDVIQAMEVKDKFHSDNPSSMAH